MLSDLSFVIIRVRPQRRKWLSQTVEAHSQSLGLKYKCVPACLPLVSVVSPRFARVDLALLGYV